MHTRLFLSASTLGLLLCFAGIPAYAAKKDDPIRVQAPSKASHNGSRARNNRGNRGNQGNQAGNHRRNGDHNVNNPQRGNRRDGNHAGNNRRNGDHNVNNSQRGTRRDGNHAGNNRRNGDQNRDHNVRRDSGHNNGYNNSRGHERRYARDTRRDERRHASNRYNNQRQNVRHDRRYVRDNRRHERRHSRNQYNSRRYNNHSSLSLNLGYGGYGYGSSRYGNRYGFPYYSGYDVFPWWYGGNGYGYGYRSRTSYNSGYGHVGHSNIYCTDPYHQSYGANWGNNYQDQYAYSSYTDGTYGGADVRDCHRETMRGVYGRRSAIVSSMMCYSNDTGDYVETGAQTLVRYVY